MKKMVKIRNDIIAVFIFLLMVVSLSSMTILSYNAEERVTVGRVSGVVNLTVTAVAGEGEGEGEGGGGGGAAGGGGGGGGTTNVYSFTLDKELIKSFLFTGQSLRESLTITNTGNTRSSFSLTINSLIDYVTLSEDAFYLREDESKTINLDINIPDNIEEDVYTGDLIIRTSSSTKTVPFILEVESIDAPVDVKVTIPEEFKRVEIGSTVFARISMFNLLNVPIPVNVYYAAKDSNGSLIGFGEEVIDLGQTITFTRSINLSSDSQIGDYVFLVKAEYRDKTAVGSDVFEVVEILLATTGKISKAYVSLFLIVLILILIVVTYEHMRLRGVEHKQKKKLSKMYTEYKREKKGSEERKIMTERLIKQKALLEKAYKSGYVSKDAYIKGNSKIGDILRRVKKE